MNSGNQLIHFIRNGECNLDLAKAFTNLSSQGTRLFRQLMPALILAFRFFKIRSVADDMKPNIIEFAEKLRFKSRSDNLCPTRSQPHEARVREHLQLAHSLTLNLG